MIPTALESALQGWKLVNPASTTRVRYCVVELVEALTLSRMIGSFVTAEVKRVIQKGVFTGI